MAEQEAEASLKAQFLPVAEALAKEEQAIVAQLSEIQGQPSDVGGYYKPEPARALAAMCPSATFNAIIASI